MKKLTISLLAMLLTLALFAGCTTDQGAVSATPAATQAASAAPTATAAAPTQAPSTKPQAPLSVVALKGPTGMGIVKLMQDDYKAKYSIALATAPDDITGQIASGQVDIAAVPINLAAALYNKTQGKVTMIAVNTLGVLYVLENGSEVNSIADLAGKTLVATGQGSTPEYIINYLLEKNGLTDKVQVEYKSEHSELATLMAAGQVKLGMLPEPNVTATLAKNKELRVALDLTEEWNKVSDTELVQGCIIVRNEVLETNAQAVTEFLNDYKVSTEFVNQNKAEAAQLIETYGIMANAALAEQAIDKCNIVFLSGEEMKSAAAAMLNVLFEANPKSVGGALPGEEFYLK